MLIVMRLYLFILLSALCVPVFALSTEKASIEAPAELPDTGVSGVYEVMVGALDEKAALAHFALFGFKEVRRAQFSASLAKQIYGVDSALTSIRLQNGTVDSHGLLRVLVWQRPQGQGVGYAPPETVGQRLSVMMVADIVRLDDLFKDARAGGEPWLPITPVFADLFGQTEGIPGLTNRRIGVRESGVYGELFNHVFFQRYGYQIKGYGTLNAQANLIASEFTHHDFIIRTDMDASTNYYRDVLGFKLEKPTSVDGDWLEGPKRVFGMPDGATHYYRGFVSPNNICGKLKFFRPRDIRSDRSAYVKIGALGSNLHSLFVRDVNSVQAAVKRAGMKPRPIQRNEFGELSFVFKGLDEVNWQVLETPRLKSMPATELTLEKVAN
jgi:catechol 2,3-dioxygenase-like lactoylglutathione lyase family enzyme